MKTYDIYGIQVHDLESAKNIVEKALSIKLVEHESWYRAGDYYRFGDIGREHFIIQKNFNEIYDEWSEENFSDMPIILYVAETNRSSKIEALLKNFQQVVLLNREEID